MAKEYSRLEEDNIDSHDKYIDMKVLLNENTKGGGNIATWKRRVADINGRPISVAYNNPLLDSQEYKIELEYGTTDRMFANNLAENV